MYPDHYTVSGYVCLSVVFVLLSMGQLPTLVDI